MTVSRSSAVSRNSPQVEDRVFGAPRVRHIDQPAQRADDQRRNTEGDGQGGERQNRDAEHPAGKGNAGQKEAGEVHAARLVPLPVRQQQRHQRHAQDADRHIDQKDPMPAEICCNEAAHRRADDGADKPGNALSHRMALTNCARGVTRTSTRRATGVISAPPKPCRNRDSTKVGSEVRHGAGDRAQHENHHGGAIDVARAPTICCPGGERDEDRQRHQIGGKRQLERDGVGVDIGGDRRQRGRDHRRVHVLHEQGHRKDDRDEAGPRMRSLRWSCTHSLASAGLW